MGRRWDGRPKVLTVTCETRAACIKEMRKKAVEWNASQDTAEQMAKGTVGDLCWKHLEYQVGHDELKPKSRDRRETTIKCHIEAYALGRMQVQAIGMSDIEKHIAILLNEDRLSDSSVKKVVDVLNAAYAWAVLQGKASTNPVAPIKETLMKRIMRKHAKTVEEPDAVVNILELIRRNAKDCSPDALVITTKTGRQNTATNLQHRMKVIFHNAGLDSYSGGLHIFRRTFATNMYDAGARVEEIAAYIGDLESTTRRYYIAIRKKVSVQGIEKQIVPLPDSIREKK